MSVIARTPTSPSNRPRCPGNARCRPTTRGIARRRASSHAGPAVTGNLEVPKIHSHLDHIDVMTYDLHGAWESTTPARATSRQPPATGATRPRCPGSTTRRQAS
jgi:hypothetical protein